MFLGTRRIWHGHRDWYVDIVLIGRLERAHRLQYVAKCDGCWCVHAVGRGPLKPFLSGLLDDKNANDLLDSGACFALRNTSLAGWNRRCFERLGCGATRGSTGEHRQAESGFISFLLFLRHSEIQRDVWATPRRS